MRWPAPRVSRSRSSPPLRLRLRFRLRFRFRFELLPPPPPLLLRLRFLFLLRLRLRFLLRLRLRLPDDWPPPPEVDSGIWCLSKFVVLWSDRGRSLLSDLRACADRFPSMMVSGERCEGSPRVPRVRWRDEGIRPALEDSEQELEALGDPARAGANRIMASPWGASRWNVNTH